MSNFRHGKKHTAVYGIWCSIRDRCNNPKNAAYFRYGGRGIGLCDRWHSFPNFYEDMGDPPPGLSIDRIDNNLGYSPDNCRWATRVEQGANKSNNRVLTLDGETHVLSEWARLKGIRVSTLHLRLKNGWPLREALTLPAVKARAGVKRGTKFYEIGAREGVTFNDPAIAA